MKESCILDRKAWTLDKNKEKEQASRSEGGGGGGGGLGDLVGLPWGYFAHYGHQGVSQPSHWVSKHWTSHLIWHATSFEGGSFEFRMACTYLTSTHRHLCWRISRLRWSAQRWASRRKPTLQSSVCSVIQTIPRALTNEHSTLVYRRMIKWRWNLKAAHHNNNDDDNEDVDHDDDNNKNHLDVT